MNCDLHSVNKEVVKAIAKAVLKLDKENAYQTDSLSGKMYLVVKIIQGDDKITLFSENYDEPIKGIRTLDLSKPITI